MNVNCHSFWFSLTSQPVICGNSDCVGKQLLTNNERQRKADIKNLSAQPAAESHCETDMAKYSILVRSNQLSDPAHLH